MKDVDVQLRDRTRPRDGMVVKRPSRNIKTFGAIRLLLCYLGINNRDLDQLKLFELHKGAAPLGLVGLIKGLMSWLHINVGTVYRWSLQIITMTPAVKPRGKLDVKWLIVDS